MRNRCSSFPAHTHPDNMYRWVLFDEFPFNINLDAEMDQHFRNFMQTRPMVGPRRMSRYVVGSKKFSKKFKN